VAVSIPLTVLDAGYESMQNAVVLVM